MVYWYSDIAITKTDVMDNSHLSLNTSNNKKIFWFLSTMSQNYIPNLLSLFGMYRLNMHLALVGDNCLSTVSSIYITYKTKFKISDKFVLDWRNQSRFKVNLWVLSLDFHVDF